MPRAHVHTAPAAEPIAIALNAAILAVRADEPVVAVVPAATGERGDDGALPCGPFWPREHPTLEAGLRFWVKRHTGIELGSLQQLCTVGGRNGSSGSVQPLADMSVVAVCYLALIGPDQYDDRQGAIWRSWYAYFPWEDWRHGKPACLASEIEPRLRAWAEEPIAPCATSEPHALLDRDRRLRIAFACDGAAWDEEKVLERYELMCEAGLLGEVGESNGHSASFSRQLPRLAHPTLGDHARVLASAIGELRRGIKCRPVLFELMGEVFTLFELQKTVEAILGPHLHKQNFRRLVEGCGLVEPTGEYRYRTGGRPAQLYRFRPDVVLERSAPGVRVKAGRG